MDNSANQEQEFYYPSEAIRAAANVPEYEALYRYSIENPEGFWGERASELDWFKPWDKVLDNSNAPFFQWFTGGKVNIVANAIDRHLKTWRRNKLALIWEGEPGDVRTFSDQGQLEIAGRAQG